MPEVQNPEGENVTISDATLTTQIAAESRSSIRSPFQVFVAAGMTPEGLAILLRNAANWAPRRLMEFAQEVEERDGHYRSVLQTRKMGVLSRPWNVAPATESPRDAEIAAFVTKTFKRKGFQGMLMDALDGLSKGFAVVELIWSTKQVPGQIVPGKYVWRDPRYFSYDFETMTDIQLITMASPTYGVPLTPAKYITHVPKLKSGKIARSGLIFTVAALYLMKAYQTKDWLAFSEVFGMPLRYAKMLEDASDEQKQQIFEALQSLGSDATAIFSKNVEVEFLGVNVTPHGDFFEKAVRFWNQEISKVVLGQTMTTEDGASLSQAKVHAEVRDDIRDADAKALAETINDSLVAPLVQMNFGADVELPMFSFDISEPEDLVALTTSIIPLIDRGLRISTSEIYERTGFTPPDEGDEILTAASARSIVEVSEGDGGDGGDVGGDVDGDDVGDEGEDE